MQYSITKEEAHKICQKALRDKAISMGLDGDKEILMSRWHLDTTRNRMNFIGTQNDTDTEEKETASRSETRSETRSDTRRDTGKKEKG